MAQFPVSSPFRKFDVRNESRTHPVGRLIGLRTQGKGTDRGGKTLQQARHPGQLLFAKAGAGMPHILQLLMLINTEKQGAKVASALTRLRPSANHKFLSPHEFYFAPIEAPSADLVE